MAGKRVGVIGTGSTGIQTIPVLAEQAAHLTVFQRTAQFSIPSANGPLDPAFVASWKTNYREWRRRGKLSPVGVPYAASLRSALDVDAEERRAAYEVGWEQGGFMFGLGTFCDLLTDEEANRTAVEFVWSKIDALVKDPEVAERLKPRTYPIGAKRLVLDTNYYETFNRSNVTLVDLREAPIEAITPIGIRTSSGEHQLDVLVYATGFDAVTGSLLALDIRGRDGATLSERWADGPFTYLGLAVPGFPNLFTITGPGSPSVLGNMPVAIEQHVDWITECVSHLLKTGVATIEATPEAATEWTEHVQDVVRPTLFTRAASWFSGANIPGKPRVFLAYAGGVDVYRARCDEVGTNGYEGFALGAGTLTTAG